MLMITKDDPSLLPPQPRRPPHSFTTSQSIAKANRSKHGLAFLAASWISGTPTIQNPTISHASLIFGVSPTSIRAASKMFDFEAAPELDAVRGRAYRDRERFVRDHAGELLAILDRVTTPAAA